MASIFGRLGSALGGVIKTAARAAIDVVPGGGVALNVYDQYNASRGRVGAFSAPGTVAVKPGGGVMPAGSAPPALTPMSGGSPTPPGTSVVPYGGGPVPGGTAVLGSGAGQVFQTPDGQWHTKSWRGTRGHMTKGTKKNPPHWTNRRRPRMNPMNVHAARRSVRRLVAGEKLFRKIFRIMHHHKPAVTPKRIGRK